MDKKSTLHWVIFARIAVSFRQRLPLFCSVLLSNYNASGLFPVQGIKAREILHANMQKIIEEKMARQQAEEEYHDAFDYMLSSAKELGQQINIQELKVPRLSIHVWKSLQASKSVNMPTKTL